MSRVVSFFSGSMLCSMFNGGEERRIKRAIAAQVTEAWAPARVRVYMKLWLVDDKKQFVLLWFHLICQHALSALAHVILNHELH